MNKDIFKITLHDKELSGPLLSQLLTIYNQLKLAAPPDSAGKFLSDLECFVKHIKAIEKI